MSHVLDLNPVPSSQPRQLYNEKGGDGKRTTPSPRSPEDETKVAPAALVQAAASRGLPGWAHGDGESPGLCPGGLRSVELSLGADRVPSRSGSPRDQD